MKKKLWWIVLGVVVLLVIVLVAALVWIDSLAKLGVEKGGTYALGVDTRLKSLHLGLVSGRLTLIGLRVANPHGYSNDPFLKSGKFDVALRPASLMSDTIQLTRFELDGLDLSIEQHTTGSNVGVILDNLKRFSSGPKETEKKPRTQKPSEGKKVQVDKVVIKNVQAKFRLLPELSPTGPVTVKVPQIELDNVSSDQGGIVMAELVARILPAILQSVFQAGEGIVPGDFLKSVNTQLNQTVKALGGEAEKLVQQAGKQLGEATKTLERDTSRAAKGLEQGTTRATKGLLQGLLGTAKKEEPSR